LLVSSNFTIEELMDRTGFTNRSTFYKAFSQRYGMPPRQYSEQQRKNVKEGQEITNA
jgi:AraC-like DNA-binding protein